MAEFGRSKQALLRQFLSLRHGIPSHDTFSRVFRLLDPRGFERAFRDFMAKFAETISGVVAIDGKALRLAYDKGNSHMPRMMVGAFAAETRLALSGLPAEGGNEREAALQLIDLLSLKGCIVTADALHCHAALAQRIVDGKGDYVLRLKDNQPSLVAGAKAALAGAGLKSACQQGLRHGVAEKRSAEVAPAAALAVQRNFPGLKAVARLTVERDGAEPEQRIYLLSRRLCPARLIEITRQHWSIENSMHWVLDTVFAEDHSRARKNNAPENLALIRRLALNIARLPQRLPGFGQSGLKGALQLVEQVLRQAFGNVLIAIRSNYHFCLNAAGLWCNKDTSLSSDRRTPDWPASSRYRTDFPGGTQAFRRGFAKCVEAPCDLPGRSSPPESETRATVDLGQAQYQ